MRRDRSWARVVKMLFGSVRNRRAAPRLARPGGNMGCAREASPHAGTGRSSNGSQCNYEYAVVRTRSGLGLVDRGAPLGRFVAGSEGFDGVEGFAVDFDGTASDQGALDAYFDGVASVTLRPWSSNIARTLP